MLDPLAFPKVTTSADVVALLTAKRLHRATSEAFYVLALNSMNAVLGIKRVARGTVDTCAVDPRDVFAFALRKRASAIIVAHNHPSGVAEPSNADLRLTEVLADGGRVLNVKVLDHVIIGWTPEGAATRACSLAERGLMPKQTTTLAAVHANR
jgi:DNA repair protein RadC